MIVLAEPYIPMALQNLANIMEQWCGNWRRADFNRWYKKDFVSWYWYFLLDILPEIEQPYTRVKALRKMFSIKLFHQWKICLIDTLFKKQLIGFFNIILNPFCQILLKIVMEWIKTFKVISLNWMVLWPSFLRWSCWANWSITKSMG